MKKNIAVIGCGQWGKNLVRNFSELGVLNSVCDSNVKTARNFAIKYNVKNLTFKEIINDSTIEGVVLTVPAKFHASMAIDVMNKGKHVFVEKPLALRVSDAKLMIETAKKKKVRLMVGHLLQYHPVFRNIKKLIKSGKVGKLNYIYSNRLSFGKVRSEENIIWSFAPHDISMILSITNEKPKFISVETKSILQKNHTDIAKIHMQFKSGLKSYISVSWLNPFKEVKLLVIGSSGILVFDDTKTWKEKLALYQYKSKKSKGLINLKRSNFKYFKIIEEEPLKIECKHFIDVVKNNKCPITDGKEGLNVLKILSASSKSKKINKRVKI